MLPSQHEIEQLLLPSLKTLERERKEVLEKIKKSRQNSTFLLVSIVVFGVLLSVIFGLFGAVELIFFIIFIGFIILSTVLPNVLKNFKNGKIKAFLQFEERVKIEVYQDLFTSLNQSCSYQPDLFITKDTFLASQLFDNGHSYQGDDYCTGKFDDGRRFEFSEIAAGRNQVASNQDNNYSNKLRSDIFKGLFIVIEGKHNLPNSAAPIFIVPNKQQDYKKETVKKTKAKPQNDNILDAGFAAPVEEKKPQSLFDQFYQVKGNKLRQQLPEALCDQLVYMRSTLRQQISMSVQPDKIYVAVPNFFSFWVVNTEQSLLGTQRLRYLAWNFKMAFEVLERLAKTTSIAP